MSQPASQARQSSTTTSPASIGNKKPHNPIAEARPSSSVILLSPTNQVLLLHRVKTSTSFPSAHVFPGGNVSRFHDLSEKGSLEEEEDDAADAHRHRDSPAYRMAAIRETFEESGILLARPRRHLSPTFDDNPDDAPLLTVPDDDVREEARRAVHRDALNFQDWLCRDLGAVSCADELVPFTRWVTPPNMTRRFTTQMYLFLMPLASPAAAAGTVDVVQLPRSDGGVEHTAAMFADAEEWLCRHARGEIVLFPPQCYLLTLVAEVLGSVPVGEEGGDGSRARYAAQREALLDFVGRTPADAAVGTAESGRKSHPTDLIPWSEKVMSPHTLFIRESDRRLVLGVDKPGPELEGSGRGGDFERVVLVKFTKQGPQQVEVRNRDDVLREEKEAAKL